MFVRVPDGKCLAHANEKTVKMCVRVRLLVRTPDPPPPRQFWQTPLWCTRGVDPYKHPAPWRGPNIRSKLALECLYGSTTRRCLYVSTFGISCDSSSFLLTSGTSDVCTGRLRADVCTGQSFRVSPSGAAQTSKRRNHHFRAISVALRGGAARCFPPPDVCAAPLCGPKKPRGTNIGFWMFVRVSLFGEKASRVKPSWRLGSRGFFSSLNALGKVAKNGKRPTRTNIFAARSPNTRSKHFKCLTR